MSDYFKDLIGQDALKRKLSFFLDAFKSTSRMPFLMFCGAKGLGKTRFMREVGASLTDPDGSKRPMLEINSSILRNNQMFFENIFLQYIHDRSITVMFDEFHNCPKDLAQALLTICNTEKEAIRNFTWQDATFSFDFRKLAFFFASTEPDKIFPPLKDRFDIVDFEKYTKEDLRKIIELNSDNTVYVDNVLNDIVDYVRGNARSCVKMAENICTYCAKMKVNTFGNKAWMELRKALNILPHGLTSSEAMILQELETRGSCSLNMLSSATGLSRTAIQSDVERHLLLMNYMKIDGKRMITKEGQRVLKEIKAFA